MMKMRYLFAGILGGFCVVAVAGIMAVKTNNNFMPVVLQTGGGDYKTINEAIYTMESGTVAPSVYNEVVNIIRYDLSSPVVVSQTGDGDYKTINEAIYAMESGTIIVEPGIYNEVVDLSNTGIRLIGTDRDNCIVQSTTGMYKDAPIMGCGAFCLQNLTIKMTLDDVGDWEPTYDGYNIPESYPGYALHIEGHNTLNTGRNIQIAKIINCTFYSEAFPAAGVGVNENQRVIFENCTFIRNAYKENYRVDKWRGAFMAHASNEDVDNQQLIIKDCVFKSNYGYAANFLMTLAGEKGMELTAINNIFWSDEFETMDCVDYAKGDSILSSMSLGNTAEVLNSE